MNSIKVNKGILQGSTLSPFLFNIYIDVLICTLKNSVHDVFAYADDIAVISKSQKELDKALNIIELWYMANKMEVNYNKSGIMVLKRNLFKENKLVINKEFNILKINNNIIENNLEIDNESNDYEKRIK